MLTKASKAFVPRHFLNDMQWQTAIDCALSRHTTGRVEACANEANALASGC